MNHPVPDPDFLLEHEAPASGHRTTHMASRLANPPARFIDSAILAALDAGLTAGASA